MLATLEVNQIRRTMRLLAVTPAAADLAGLAAACGATMIDRTDRQSGYLRPDQLGHVPALGQHRQDQPPDHLRRTAAHHVTSASRWAYVAALAPIIFGTTYLLTSEFLPPGRPLLAALMRSLPTGLILIIGSRPPDRQWLGRFAVLSVLYASGLFPLLFLAAYLLPGGVASVINSLSPLLVVVLSVPLLGSKIRSGPGDRRLARHRPAWPCWCSARRPGSTRSACWP